MFRKIISTSKVDIIINVAGDLFCMGQSMHVNSSE